jgi:hypothetical protein
METLNKLTGEQLSLWTLSAEDIHANPSAPQVNEKEPMTLDTCGLGLEQPLASYNLSTQSWRMSEDISLWGDYRLLENLPRSGMTRNGVLYQQQEWVRPIDEIESSLWPTPTTQENEHPNAIWNEQMRRVAPNGSTHSINLADAVRMWPTPTVDDSKNVSRKSGTFQSLTRSVQESSTANGKLNPAWVEWLMGFPIGWTDLED